MRIHVWATQQGAGISSDHRTIDDSITPHDLAGHVLAEAAMAVEMRRGEAPIQVRLEHGTEPRLLAWEGTASPCQGEGMTITNTKALFDAVCALVEAMQESAGEMAS